MKVRIRKHCKINGTPAHPGDLHEVPDHRAKALTDNGYAEAVEDEKASADSGDPVEEFSAGDTNPANAENPEDQE